MIVRLAKSLYLWAKDNPENKAKLIAKRNEVIEAINSNNGKDLVSGNIGDASVTYQTNGMTNLDYLSAVELALESLELGIFRNANKGRIVYS